MFIYIDKSIYYIIYMYIISCGEFCQLVRHKGGMAGDVSYFPKNFNLCRGGENGKICKACVHMWANLCQELALTNLYPKFDS